MVGLVSLFYFECRARTGSLTAVVGALDAEVELIRNNLENAQQRAIEGINFTSGEIHGRKVVVAATGVGKVNAAMTTMLLISHFKPSEIISTGVAGAINPDLAPGDIVFATKTAQHDLGFLAENGLTGRGVTNPRTGGKNPIFFPSNFRLLDIAETAALYFYGKGVGGANFSRASRIFRGVIVSGDVFISSNAKKTQLRQDFGADVAEMEAAAAAQVCWQMGTPYMAVRCISDLANTNSEDVFGKTHRTSAIQASKLVLRMIELLGSK